MKNKLIIFDLDGTAVNSPTIKLPSNRLVKIINHLKNEYYISCATGRSWNHARDVINYLSLTDPLVISAGTQIYNPASKKVVWKQTIPSESLALVIEIFKQYPEYKLIFNDYSEDEYFNGGIYPKDFVTKLELYFLEQKFVPEKNAEEIFKQLVKIPGIKCISCISQLPGTRDFHITSINATKKLAIEKLLNLLKIDKVNTIGIGDGNNDMELFEAVGKKVAMGNAVPSLKQMADLVIDGVEIDGLANYLETMK